MAKRTPRDQNRLDDGMYASCFVAFLDILGFKKKVLQSQENLNALAQLVEFLTLINAIPSGGKKVSRSLGEEREIPLRSRFFSDSLIFYMRDKPDDLAHLFFIIRYLQDQLWERAICLRGAIVRGRMRWTDQDDRVTIGPGLLEAHKLETTLAIFPRIVVSNDLHEYVSQKKIFSIPFGMNERSYLKDFIRQDVDGVFFLDLLNPLVNRPREEQFELMGVTPCFAIRYDSQTPSRHPEVLRFVDRLVKENAKCENERVRQKNAWLETYRKQYGKTNASQNTVRDRT